jgi:hypothetical protein
MRRLSASDSSIQRRIKPLDPPLSPPHVRPLRPENRPPNMSSHPRPESNFGRPERYRAAITMISTPYWGAASLASTVARAGVFPADTQPSHTAFISAKVFMSVR